METGSGRPAGVGSTPVEIGRGCRSPVSEATECLRSSRLWINSLLGRMDAIAGAQLP